MKHFFALFFLAILTSTQALADWDAESEAREQAQRDAEQREQQQKQREIDKMKADLQKISDKDMMDSKRKTVGAAAKGKSDAEVNRLYDAKIKKDTAAANKTAAEGRKALSHGDGAVAVKQVTGKSMKELENMSDEEADALAKEMEKKYGTE